MTWIYLLAAIGSEVVGTTCLRASEGFTRRRWIAPALMLQGAAILLLFLCLQEGLTIGVATGLWSAIGVAMTAVMARVLFGDALTIRTGVGIGFIAIGVLLIGLGGR